MLSASGHGECPSADFSSDCKVGLADLAVMANEWAGQINIPLLYDMADQWLTEGVPDDPENLVWVYIDDPGVDEDADGIPDYEGFTGEMSRYKTTNAQYCAYLNSVLADGSITVYNNKVYASIDPGHFQVYCKTWPTDSDSQITYDAGASTFDVRSRDDLSMADHPVVRVSWYGATAFCDYYGYRLPTEWEWEAVADHYGEFTYGCGTTIDQTTANYYGNRWFYQPA